MPAIENANSNLPVSTRACLVNPGGGYRIQVSRQGTAVHLTLVSGNDYAAVELYEHFVQALEGGRLSLELK